MKKILLCAAAVSIAALAINAKKTNDPVVMTIDGKPVHQSEFEYLYNKNNAQQVTPLGFDEYVDMFVNYKLKVADAIAAGIDTTADFRNEFERFRADLAKPYLKDTVVEAQLVREAYDHMLEEVYVSHIMLPAQDPRSQAIADSLRNAIIGGLTTFEEAAAQFSIDKASAVNGGRMAWVMGNGRFPWPFEKASYDTPVGEISQPVNSGFGWHLVRPEQRRKALGEVNARHILVMTRGVAPDQLPDKKALIDSIYALATAPGADFAALASEFSEDPGSARNGGDLGWFSSGMMVQPFDSLAFALPVGAISEPFETAFGWHILQKVDARGVASFEESKPQIEKAIGADQRQEIPVQALIKQVAETTGSAIDPAYLDRVTAVFTANNNASDSTSLSQLRALDVPAFTVAGKSSSVAQVLKNAPIPLNTTADIAIAAIKQTVDKAFDDAILDYQTGVLESSDPDFRNLVNEYRDGILLFDISNEKVWDRAAKDKEGLKQYFEAHKDSYANWTAPKFKAYVIFSNDEATLAEVEKFVNDNFGGQSITVIDQEALTEAVQNQFPRKARVERVIAAQGENAITDYLGFGAEKPEAKSQAWPYYFAFAGEIIDQPVEVADARGAVVTDYQNMLEKAWVDQLRKAHKVKVNKKQLNKINK